MQQAIDVPCPGQAVGQSRQEQPKGKNRDGLGRGLPRLSVADFGGARATLLRTACNEHATVG